MDNEIRSEEFTPVENPKALIEAIMFAAGYPMRYDKLASVIGITPSEVKQYAAELANEYAGNSDRGIMVLLFPETCQLCTREEFAPYIKEALGIKRGGNLSASSMEVLAIVAYNQPVTRSFVDLVRGVDSSYAMNSLIDKALIEATGRLDAPGRPMLYSTTDKFLRVFGLSSLKELPEVEMIRPSDEQMAIISESAEQTDD